MSSTVSKIKDENVFSHEENGAGEPPDDRRDDRNDEGEDRPGDGDIQELRKLLVQSQEVGEVLPEAVKQSAERDPHLARATLPIVEENIRQSVERDPKVLAEALFPAIGPAIRKAIAQALSSMVQSLNQTLEYSFSPKGIGWRLEALRTGKSFGEVVMLKTLLFRVEQVFLIHKKTGLLLQHVAANPKDIQDADMVSAMLTAIEDFVHDSFETSANATLDSLKIKELSVWVEHSPGALVAAVIRGTPPLALRETFSEAIELIQLRYEPALTNFDGRPEIFDECRPILEDCLEFQLSESEKGKSAIRPMHLIAGSLGLIVLLFAIYFGWDYWKWSGYVDRLREEPGIVVAETDYGIFEHSVSGLRDPLAVDPVSLLGEYRYDEDDIAQNWRLYNDADPSFVLQRAGMILNPPNTVKLSIDNGVLTASGSVPAEWLKDARPIARSLAGVTEFRVNDENLELINKIQSQSILFDCNTVNYSENQVPVLDRVAKDIEKISETDGSVEVEIRGFASELGEETANESISRSRAEKVRNDLLTRSSKLREIVKKHPQVLKIVGLGESQDDDRCKVSFRVDSK